MSGITDLDELLRLMSPKINGIRVRILYSFWCASRLF